MGDAKGSSDYRTALSTFTTGVCVVLADFGHEIVGLTVNSFSSVSLHPPIVSWCAGLHRMRSRRLANAERFSINVLGEDQVDVAHQYAAGEAAAQPTFSRRGTPTVSAAIAMLDCDFDSSHLVGDHCVVFAEVVDFSMRDGDGLVFFRGGYSSTRNILKLPCPISSD